LLSIFMNRVARNPAAAPMMINAIKPMFRAPYFLRQ
jgi:hypothetical protein